jgi:SAM-dependent methyltransferase
MSTVDLVREDTPQPPWFASWFDSPHYHSLYAYRDEAEAAGFVNAILECLRPAGGARSLDLGCGAGRHARLLASKGLDVVGLDLSSRSIERARQWEHPRLRFVRQDMRQPFGVHAFDYVFNLFTSFGYFDRLTDHLKIVRNIGASLETGGTFVFDYLNVRHAEARLTREEVIECVGVRYRISRWSDACHFFKRIVVQGDRASHPLEQVEQVAKFAAHDLQLMFALYGMRVEQLYGDYALSPYDPDTSPRLIMLARKE